MCWLIFFPQKWWQVVDPTVLLSGRCCWLRLPKRRWYNTKNQFRKSENNIPRKGIAQPQSQFPHSYVCEQCICSHNQSECLFCFRKYVDLSWECIIRSQTHECGNWDWGRAIPRKVIHKCDFCCSVIVWYLLWLTFQCRLFIEQKFTCYRQCIKRW